MLLFKSSQKIITILIGVVLTTNLFANLPTETRIKCRCENGNMIRREVEVPVGAPSNQCLNFDINFGHPANEPDVPCGFLNIYTLEPSPVVYSPQCLQFHNIITTGIYRDQINTSEVTASTVNGETVYTDTYGNTYTEEDVTSELSSTYYRQVKIFTDKRRLLEFKFKKNESSAKLSNTDDLRTYVMVMTDANGNPVTVNPTYFRMYIGKGNFVKYSVATNKVVSFNSATGRVVTPDSPSIGLETICDDSGIIRQVYSVADGLADIVIIDDQKYEIRLYTPENAGSKTDGLYVPTGNPSTTWTIYNPTPGQSNKVYLTKTSGGNTTEYKYEYNYSVENWMLTFPDNLAIVSKSTSWDYSRTVRTEIRTVKTPDGKVAYKIVYVSQTYDFGDRVVVQIVDPDGLNKRTTYTYYTSGNGYGRINTSSSADGSWRKYEYNDKGYPISVITPYKNSPMNSPAGSAKATYFSYTPVDSRDVPTYDDARPRTTEEKTLGITTGKTYNAYYFDNGEYTEVTERCSVGSATYGASSSLRTIKRYYPSTADAASCGRLKSITYPNGLMDNYSYEYGNWTENADPAQSVFTPGTGAALRTSIIRGTTANPSGIANKTLKNTIVNDVRGNVVMKEQYVYTGSTYERGTWTVMTYDQEHHLLNTYNSNGTEENNIWNCCSKESETGTDGTQYTYSYDALQRMTSKTKVGAGGQPNIVTSYTYDAIGNQLSETISAGGLSLSSSKEYDPAGQITKETDTRGLATTYTYFNGVNTGTVKGAVTTATLPGGYLKTEENYLDGQLKELTGNAVIAQYYDYGVNADGSIWTKILTGRNDSARWQKTTIDILGRIVKEERSGYGGTVTSQNFYNDKSQLVKTTTTGQADTLYVYTELNELFRFGLDINANGTLDLASTDRINEMETGFASEFGAWWKVRTGKVYGTDNSDTATINGIQKTRLNGFTSSLTAESKFIDINGNETDQTTTIDRTNKTVSETVNVPESSVDEQTITINGLVTSKRTKSNLTYTYSYDSLERNTGITDPRTGTMTATYYAEGTGRTGQLYTVTDAANNVTTYDYDPATGQKKSVKNALNKYTYLTYNALDKITRIWGDTSYPIEFTFDNFGQMTQLKTYRGGTGWSLEVWPVATTGDAELTQLTYNEATGRVVSKTYADGKGTTYTYTVDGKPLTRIWARTFGGNPLVTTYSYDNHTGELTGVDYSDSTPDITFSYTRVGQKHQVTDVVGTRTFAYNSALQPTTETIIGGLYSKIISRDYTTTGIIGRYSGLHIGTEYDVDYGYDIYGRLNTITNGSDVYTYGYLANSNLVASIAYPNTITSSNVYEANRNLVNYVENKFGTTTISKYDYTYDALGRRTSMVKSGTAFTANDTVNYTYNDRSELTGADAVTDNNYNFAYNFDNIGNRTSYTSNESSNPVQSIYTVNNLNQYTAITNPTLAPTYDDDGNMLNDNIWSFTWNAENRLIVAEKSDAKLEFQYDYMGRRIEKKVYSGSAGSWTLSKHLKFVYDGYEQIEELDGTSNAILKKRIWELNELICDIQDSTAYYVLGDVNKNITEYIDSSGNIQAHYEYSPFGKITTKSGSKQNDFDYCFSSELFDSISGLLYYNHRYYNPVLGRWTKRDPIDERGGINLYLMTNNDPTNRTDRLGLFGANSLPGNWPGGWDGPLPPNIDGSGGSGSDSDDSGSATGSVGTNNTTSACGMNCCGNTPYSPGTTQACCKNKNLYNPQKQCCNQKTGEVTNFVKNDTNPFATIWRRDIDYDPQTDGILVEIGSHFFYHAEMWPGTTYPVKEDTSKWQTYPAYHSSSGTMDDGTPCKCVSKSRTTGCLKRNSYSAGKGWPWSNCQSNTQTRMGRCCLYSSWTPQYLAHPIKDIEM